MSLIETIHELSPGWVLVPVILFAIAILLEEYTGAEFKKGPEENEHVKHNHQQTP